LLSIFFDIAEDAEKRKRIEKVWNYGEYAMTQVLNHDETFTFSKILEKSLRSSAPSAVKCFFWILSI
jgi:hypothetical protein